MRAMRLASELGFIVERKTEIEISRSVNLIAGVPGERVREELLRMLNSYAVGRFLLIWKTWDC